MKLWRVAFHESAQALNIEGFVKAALVASNDHLLSRRPQDALILLDIAKAAAEHARRPLGSDHFRQRGVAAFQLGLDDESRHCFDRAVVAMVELGEAKTVAMPLMTGARHTTLLGTPDWDGSLEVRDVARQSFGENSLEYSMATNWAAACAFSTDSQPAWQTATQILAENIDRASGFGHQSTVTKLLSILPDLGLYPRLTRSFARRALYENTSRGR